MIHSPLSDHALILSIHYSLNSLSENLAPSLSHTTLLTSLNTHVFEKSPAHTTRKTLHSHPQKTLAAIAFSHSHAPPPLPQSSAAASIRYLHYQTLLRFRHSLKNLHHRWIHPLPPPKTLKSPVLHPPSIHQPLIPKPTQSINSEP